MGRLLLLIILALVVYTFLKGSKARLDRGGTRTPGRRSPERMVTCSHCGVHLPESDSIRVGDLHFCSEEHRRLAG